MTDPHLANYPVIYETDVIWGDMDAFQHVNNVVYFRYFESARVHYFQQVDLLGEMRATGVGPIVHSQRCRYLFPLTFPDHIQVGVRISGMGEDRFVFDYRVVSTRHQVVAATGETLVVMFDYRNNRKAPVPPALLDLICGVEGWEPDAIPPLPGR